MFALFLFYTFGLQEEWKRSPSTTSTVLQIWQVKKKKECKQSPGNEQRIWSSADPKSQNNIKKEEKLSPIFAGITAKSISESSSFIYLVLRKSTKIRVLMHLISLTILKPYLLIMLRYLNCYHMMPFSLRLEY